MKIILIIKHVNIRQCQLPHPPAGWIITLGRPKNTFSGLLPRTNLNLNATQSIINKQVLTVSPPFPFPWPHWIRLDRWTLQKFNASLTCPARSSSPEKNTQNNAELRKKNSGIKTQNVNSTILMCDGGRFVYAYGECVGLFCQNVVKKSNMMETQKAKQP